jgi:carbon storage regulator
MTMLVLTRKPGQSIMIGDGVEVQVLSVAGEKVRLGITAPRDVSIFRNEVYDRIESEQGRSRGTDDQANGARNDDGDDRDRQTDEQDAEPDLALGLVARDAAGARAVDRALAQLLAPASLERHLLLERQLDLSHALSHPHLSHRESPPGRPCRLATNLARA